MVSVSRRVKETEQPRGGFIKPSSMEKKVLGDGLQVISGENIPPNLVGTAVDYLTRFMLGVPVEEAFRVSLKGAEELRDFGIDESVLVESLVNGITGLDDESVICACKLVGFDVCYRREAYMYEPVQKYNPDEATVVNIRTMVERSLHFFDRYGPVVMVSPTFEGAYTARIDSGDADYATRYTIWDMKVSKSGPTKEQTLQALIYFLMAKRSVHEELHNLIYVGIFNPRSNTVYRYKVSDMDEDVLDGIKAEVIGY